TGRAETERFRGVSSMPPEADRRRLATQGKSGGELSFVATFHRDGLRRDSDFSRSLHFGPKCLPTRQIAYRNYLAAPAGGFRARLAAKPYVSVRHVHLHRIALPDVLHGIEKTSQDHIAGVESAPRRLANHFLHAGRGVAVK